jgi:NAD+ diphosphatase
VSPGRTFPHVALSAHAHNRQGMLRTDQEWLDRQWADPGTRVLVVAGSRIRPVDGEVSWVPPDDAPAAGTRVLLGEREGRTWFALIVDPDEAPGSGRSG